MIKKIFGNSEKETCPYCVEGEVEVLMNAGDYHYRGEAPIIDWEPCEECGGTGEIEIEDE